MNYPLISTNKTSDEIVDPSTLECPICLHILYEPYVGCCGHTYCLRCLADLSRFDKKCAVCRQRLGKFNEWHPNVLVKYLIQKHFPDEFNARQQTEASSTESLKEGLKLILRNEKKKRIC